MIQLEPNERIIVKVRKHWFILLTETVIVILLVLSPLAVFEILEQTGWPATFNSDNRGSLALFFYPLWLLVSVIVFFAFWTDYYLDIWIVTTERIIAIEQKGIFHRASVSFRLDRIQDLTVEINGIIPTLLNFGTLHVHTAGQNKDISLQGAREPERAKQIIYQEQNKLPAAGRSIP